MISHAPEISMDEVSTEILLLSRILAEPRFICDASKNVLECRELLRLDHTGVKWRFLERHDLPPLGAEVLVPPVISARSVANDNSLCADCQAPAINFDIAGQISCPPHSPQHWGMYLLPT